MARLHLLFVTALLCAIAAFASAGVVLRESTGKPSRFATLITRNDDIPDLM